MSLYAIAEIIDLVYNYNNETIGYRIYDNKTMKYIDTSLESVKKQLLNGTIISGLNYERPTDKIKNTYGVREFIREGYVLDAIAYDGKLPDYMNKHLWTVILQGNKGVLAVSKGGITKKISYESLRAGNSKIKFANFKYELGSGQIITHTVDKIDTGDVQFTRSAKNENLTTKINILAGGRYKLDYDGTLLIIDKDIKHIKIPSICTKIPREAFSDSKIENVIIGPNIKKIERSAFDNCRMLKEISIPGTVKAIGPNCFRNCESLQKVTLGEGIERIGTGAFTLCESLKYLRLPHTLQGSVEVNLMVFVMESEILIDVPKEFKDKVRKLKSGNIKVRFY